MLRRYRRGGMIARLSRDSYLWAGEDRTRSFREYRLLAAMRRQGLDVPAPLAAAYWRQGPVYRAAILVERIPGVKPLAQMLAEPLWGAGGRGHRPHAPGRRLARRPERVQYPDRRRGRVWLIDFDRGTQGRLSDRQRQGSLERLRRSLNKVAGTPASASGSSCATATGRRGAWASSLDAGEGRPSGADGAQTRRSSPICGKKPPKLGGPR